MQKAINDVIDIFISKVWKIQHCLFSSKTCGYIVSNTYKVFDAETSRASYKSFMSNIPYTRK